MGGFALTLGLGLVIGCACGLLLSSMVIALIEGTGRALEEWEDE